MKKFQTFLIDDEGKNRAVVEKEKGKNQYVATYRCQNCKSWYWGLFTKGKTIIETLPQIKCDVCGCRIRDDETF